MSRLGVFVFCMLAVLDVAGAQSIISTAHNADGTVVVSCSEKGRRYSFSFRPPSGWVEVAYPNLPPAFFPRDGASINTSILIETHTEEKSALDVKNSKELAALDERRDQVHDPRTHFEPAGSLKTASDAPALLFFVHRSGSSDLLAYADEGTIIAVLSLSCPSDDILQFERGVFEKFAGSYGFTASQAQGKRW